MNLKEYIQSGRGRGIALAEALGIPQSFLSQMASGERGITAERAAAIEAATQGALMRWDLCPDNWRDVWPELVNHPSAPSAQEA